MFCAAFLCLPFTQIHAARTQYAFYKQQVPYESCTSTAPAIARALQPANLVFPAVCLESMLACLSSAQRPLCLAPWPQRITPCTETVPSSSSVLHPLQSCNNASASSAQPEHVPACNNLVLQCWFSVSLMVKLVKKRIGQRPAQPWHGTAQLRCLPLRLPLPCSGAYPCRCPAAASRARQAARCCSCRCRMAACRAAGASGMPLKEGK